MDDCQIRYVSAVVKKKEAFFATKEKVETKSCERRAKKIPLWWYPTGLLKASSREQHSKTVYKIAKNSLIFLLLVSNIKTRVKLVGLYMTIVNQIGSIPPYHISVPSPSCLESYWITLPLPPPEHNTHTPKFRHNFAVVYENCMAAYTLYQPLYTKTIIIFASIGSLRVPSFFPVASASSAATGLFHSLWQ